MKGKSITINIGMACLSQGKKLNISEVKQTIVITEDLKSIRSNDLFNGNKPSGKEKEHEFAM